MSKIKMTTKEKLSKAMNLLQRAANRLSDDLSPDITWWPDLFAITGEHMILTDQGWEPGSAKEFYLEDWKKNPEWSNPILYELNAPEGSSHD